jgi:hypothetical protein
MILLVFGFVHCDRGQEEETLPQALKTPAHRTLSETAIYPDTAMAETGTLSGTEVHTNTKNSTDGVHTETVPSGGSDANLGLILGVVAGLLGLLIALLAFCLTRGAKPEPPSQETPKRSTPATLLVEGTEDPSTREMSGTVLMESDEFPTSS